MTSQVKCKGCGKLVQEDLNFCPYCGTTLGKLEDEYIFETMEDYTSMSKENLDRFLKFMKKPDELKEIIQEKKPQIFEEQKEITQKILDRFPEIKRYILEDQKVEFKAFIISMPYEKEPNVLQHDCLLRRLSMDQNGLVNFSLGSIQLATGLYAFDVPVWAPKKIGHELLFDQKKQIEKCMPTSQQKFLYSAEPWWVCSKVFDLDGRWVNWRLLFKTEGFMDYLQEQEEIPLNFHLFSNMEYSDLFSIAGTSGDGEVLIGVHRIEEDSVFKNQLHELEELYRFGKTPEVEIIEVSWDTLESLGLIGVSAQQLLKSERGHFFRKTLSERVIESVEQKTVLDAKGIMTGGKDSSPDEFVDRISRKILWLETQGQQKGVVRITQGISRELRKDYRILGDKA